ncbi:MAG: hypothetical protein KDL87_11225 [Verrucomicrobiae bacterium]|nr:hypothetical protein [Verrucomicrobiae bacterium]
MKASSSNPIRAIQIASPRFVAIVLTLFSLSATASQAKDQGPPIQLLKLADGQEVHASITGYSLQSRVITLQRIDGSIFHVAPRDLTAMSKLKWLTSPAFTETLKSYRPTNKALAVVIAKLTTPTLAAFLTGFLSFWMAAGLVSGQKKIGLAMKTYSKSIFISLLISGVTGVAMFAVSDALGDSPVTPMAISAACMAGLIALTLVTSSQIAGDYDLAGTGGFGVVTAATAICGVIAVSVLYLLPRYLNEPGIDDWFTDQLLVPLGLA